MNLSQTLATVIGFDLNPLAVILCRASLSILVFSKTGDFFFPRVFLHNPLFPGVVDPSFLIPTLDSKTPAQKFSVENLFGQLDLVIGNPPWLVVNRMHKEAYRDAVKDLGAKYGIFLGGKTATSTEITTVFIYHAIEVFLRENGLVFFVTPASLLTGSQHERFRSFRGMRDVEFWKFDRDLFRIHSTCFKARKHAESDLPATSNLKVQVTTFHCSEDPLAFEEIERETYAPAYLRRKKGHLHVGRLNPESETLPTRWIESPYREKFFQGASLVPRNLVLVDFEEERGIVGLENSLVTVIPARRMQRKKDARWNFSPFTSAVVEREFLKPIAKSSNLIPFVLTRTEMGFIPLLPTPENGGYSRASPETMAPATRDHVLLLEELYQSHRKPEARVKTYWDRLNYHKYLTNPLQRAPFRVIYNGIGSLVKAALLRDSDVIVDTSLYQCAPTIDGNAETEGYFLLGVLNSPVITRVAELTGSSGAHGSLRNIHLNPFSVDIPLFTGNPRQQDIATRARDLEMFVHAFFEENTTTEIKPKTVQARLVQDPRYVRELAELDAITRALLSKAED